MRTQIIDSIKNNVTDFISLMTGDDKETISRTINDIVDDRFKDSHITNVIRKNGNLEAVTVPLINFTNKSGFMGRCTNICNSYNSIINSCNTQCTIS